MEESIYAAIPEAETLVGKLWAIIVLAVAAIFIGVVFGPGIAKMIAGPTYFAPLDDHDVLSCKDSISKRTLTPD